MWSLWPTMMKGTPGSETPATWKLPVGAGAARSGWYQIPGTECIRCMSFERSGFPEAVREPEMTQLLEPAMQDSQGGPRDLARPRMSSGVAVVRDLFTFD